MIRNDLDSFLKTTGQSDKIFLETATVLAHNRLQWNLIPSKLQGMESRV